MKQIQKEIAADEDQRAREDRFAARAIAVAAEHFERIGQADVATWLRNYGPNARSFILAKRRQQQHAADRLAGYSNSRVKQKVEGR